ncbi:ABC transporter substrate-binding protein [Pontibacter arcticus]|uniref:Leucine-binding protein domain-containing protein n=1 Tax=Pontibacter arcticus TaxID=2080288 RepID=A0A364RF43_9BACT|nr:ABC transporter substrate-binding protein [Pontibacter arcticus]RAU82960.1 hypothetical protein DP923_06885 [Pontibacter arcticus]
MKKSSCFWRNVIGLLAAGLLAVPVQAQVQDAATAYNNGKVLVQQQRYPQAMAELLPLTTTSAFAPEASYFYALAALKAGKADEAYKMLLQLQNKHSNWENMADADYLLANTLFELKEYDRALSKLKELEGSALATDAEGLKRFYLTKLADRAAFEKLLAKYDSDKVVAQSFADKLLSGWFRPQDRPLLESIVSKFNLDRSRYLSKNAFQNQGFHVAVLLPFQLTPDALATARKNTFATDMYAGMKLAQDSLKQQGINLNLYTYDSGTDTLAVKKTLALPEMQQMNLIIGPVYRAPAKIAARYAAQQNIALVNPLSEDADMAKGFNNVFLFESSVATKARQAASYAYQNFMPKTAVIIYENAKDDTTFAYHYRQQFVKLGGKVKTYQKINPAQASATAAAFNKLILQDVGHLAVFSDKMPAAVNATSVLQSKAPKLPLITYDKWLDINQVSLRQLDDLEVYFINPKYIDKQSPAATAFKKAYTSQYNLPPSVYAYTGFEMVYYFGTLLQKYGPQFSESLVQTALRPVVFYKGFGYYDPSQRNQQISPDNQYVPITKLENLQLMVVNPVY